MNNEQYREMKHHGKHDQPSCTNPVPEPNTFVLLGLGILFLVFILRKMSKK